MKLAIHFYTWMYENPDEKITVFSELCFYIIMQRDTFLGPQPHCQPAFNTHTSLPRTILLPQDNVYMLVKAISSVQWMITASAHVLAKAG